MYNLFEFEGLWWIVYEGVLYGGGPQRDIKPSDFVNLKAEVKNDTIVLRGAFELFMTKQSWETAHLMKNLCPDKFEHRSSECYLMVAITTSNRNAIKKCIADGVVVTQEHLNVAATKACGFRELKLLMDASDLDLSGLMNIAADESHNLTVSDMIRAGLPANHVTIDIAFRHFAGDTVSKLLNYKFPGHNMDVSSIKAVLAMLETGESVPDALTMCYIDDSRHEILEVLLMRGMCVNVTHLAEASKRGHKKCLELLISYAK